MLGKSTPMSQMNLEYLRDNVWLDRFTVGAVLEFGIYNADVNLATMVRLKWQFPVCGGSLVDINIDSIRLYRPITDSLHIAILTSLLLLILFSMFIFVRGIREIKRHRMEYLLSVSFLFDVATCVLAGAVVAMFVRLTIRIDELVKMYRRHDELMHQFDSLIDVENTMSFLYGLLVMVGMLKFLHLLRMNAVMWRYMSALKIAFPQLIIAFFMMSAYFFGFASLMTLLGNPKVKSFKTLGASCATLLEGMVGIIYYEDLQSIHRLFGPFIFFACLGVMCLLMFDFMISILFASVRAVSRKPLPNDDIEVFRRLRHRIMDLLGIRHSTD